MKKGNLLWFATIFLSSILLMTNSCKKDEELSQEEIRLQKEQQIIELVEDQMPSVIVQYFNNHLEESRNQPNYDDYLDSLNTAINELYTTIEQSFSLDEFKSRFETVVAELDNQLKSTGTCVGLGYSKAAEVNVGGSGAIGIGIVAGLEAAGGGGLEYVYDFVNLDRQLYYYTVCSYGFSFGAGLAAGLSGSVGFTGIYSLLTGISYHGNTTGLNKFEGPSLGKSHTLSAGLQKVLGLDLSVTIGSSSAAYADFSGLLNLSPCPYTLTVLENSSKSYSFAVAGSLSYGPAVELLLAYSNNQVGSNSTGVVNTYHRFPGGRVIAGLKMAKELAIGEPMAGIITTLNPFDLSAAAVAITYAFKDFSNCPSSNSAIGTFPVENITSSSAQFGGVITNDNGSPITVRGFVWSTNENPTISNNFGITNEGTGIGEFTSNITGLNPNTTYYVKAYATNGAGTAYGQQVEFKTLNQGGSYILEDDFENYNINSFPSEGGWVIRYNGAGNSYQYITDQYQNSGNKSFRLHGVSNWDARIINELSDTPSQVYFEVSFFSENINHNGSFGLHNPNVGTWGSGKIGVGFNNGFITVAGTEIMEYNPDIWNTVKVKADMINNKFSVWVNNVEYVTNQDYNYPDFQYTHFQLTGRNNSANNIVFYDDVKVWVE